MEISRQEALDCFASDDLIGIGMEADAIRRSLHPENVVTYAATHVIAIDQPLANLLTRIEDSERGGDTTVCFSNSLGDGLEHLEETFAAIHLRFPSLRIQALSSLEIFALAQTTGLGPGEVLIRLRASGLDSLSAEDISAHQAAGRDLRPDFDVSLEIHRLSHRSGMTSTASLFFGAGETAEDRVHHLFAIRAQQAETSGFTACTLVAPAPGTHLEPPTAVEYLRTLAIARIVLENVPSIESSCVAHGLKVTQMALRFGANDAGPLADTTTPKAAFTEEDLRRVIRDAGFIPVERDHLYRTLFLNN